MKAFVLFFIVVTRLHAEVLPGDKAPDFNIKSSDETIEKLSTYRNQFVVLEWFNKECPFVRKHYDTFNIQSMQKQFTSQNVIWFTVISSAPGKQGFVNADEANKVKQKEKAAPTRILLDSKGTLGHLYGAKTTPFMVLINPDGVVVYVGAIDETPSFAKSDVATSKNLFAQALSQSLKGEAVTTKFAKPYGCAVKY